MTATVQVQVSGWSETNSEGIPTIYLALTDEGITTSPTDTPASVDFRQFVINADQFSIKRAPVMWPEGSTAGQAAAFGQLQLDNFDGDFDNLIQADLRDTPVIIKLLAAKMLGTGTEMADAFTVATGIIDNIASDEEDIVVVNIKDTIARLDKTLPCKINPQFAASGAAGVMVPILLGTGRNVGLLLADQVQRLFQVHDAPIANIAVVTDKAAPLDPNANPPQYTPASILGGYGIQVATMPEGKIVCDASSGGTQAVIPGVNDILSGAGKFPGTQGTGAWFGGCEGYAGVTSGSITGSGATRVITLTHNGPANGKKVYATDGTTANTVYGTITSGGGTTSITIGTLTIVGSTASIPSGSHVVIPGAPDGFTWSGTASSVSEFVNPPNTWLPASTNGGQFSTGTAFDPPGALFGGVLQVNVEPLLSGISYRVTFRMSLVNVSQPFFSNGRVGGLLLATALTDNAADYITGIATPLQTTLYAEQSLMFEFTIPNGSAPRNLYFIVAPAAGNVPTTPNGGASVQLADIQLEQLGQFTALPLTGIPFDQYCTELLVIRAGEDPSIFNSTEAAALFKRADGSLIPFGMNFTSPPNILDALQGPLDNQCAVKFTDANGVLRFRKFKDPSDPANTGSIKCDFTPDNVMRPIQMRADNATGLTTIFGARRNWSVFSASDFVTDQAIVTQDEKTRYMRTSQYQGNSSLVPASQYLFAVKAPIFDMILDLVEDAQDEIDRVVGIWSPKIYDNNTFTTGKRRLITFTALFDDPAAVGINTTAACTDIQFGDIVSFTYPSHGFNNTLGAVIAWEIFAFAQQITLTIMV